MEYTFFQRVIDSEYGGDIIWLVIMVERNEAEALTNWVDPRHMAM